MKYLIVKCITETCPKFGQEINKIEFDDGPRQEELMDLMIENWGSGSEDSEDCCSECGALGELVEPEEA